VRFRKKSASLAHEQLTQLALTRGNAERGRKVFANVEKSQCLKCHRLSGQGTETIGPDLTGLGKRFSRVFIIESLLEPSRSISPAFTAMVVELKDGKVLTGLRLAETATTLTIADQQGKKHDIPLTAIEARRPHPQSVMPDGLERTLTADEFADLVAFLAIQK
jgi:putative heme-binding domain-containing protein